MYDDPRAATKELEAAAGEELPEGTDAQKAVRRMRRALDDARIVAAADRKQADRLASRTGERAVYVEVPALEEDVHDLGGLAEIARHLTREAVA
jgi:hypothetical protein